MKNINKRNSIIVSLILMVTITFLLTSCKSAGFDRGTWHSLLAWLAIVGGFGLLASLFALFDGNYGLVIFVLILEAALICGVVLTREAKTPRNQAASAIENRIDDMKSLRSDLKKKIKKMGSLKADYQRDIRKLENEILSEKTENRITSYEQAIQNQIIAYNLSLISKKRAYIHRVDELYPQIELGINELIYLERDARIDLKMIKVLGGKEAEDIMNKISRIVEKYLPHAGKLVIEIDESEVESLREVWNQIVRRGR